MLFKKALILAALTLANGASHAWTLIYSHDANGGAGIGSLQALRNAASNGSSIKVVVASSNDHDWQLPCHQVSVKTDGTQEVVCFSKMDLLTRSKTDAQYGTIVSPPQFLHFTINTLGQYAESSIQLSNGSALSTKHYRFPVRWYAE